MNHGEIFALVMLGSLIERVIRYGTTRFERIIRYMTTRKTEPGYDKPRQLNS